MRRQGAREESLHVHVQTSATHTHAEFVCPDTTFLRSTIVIQEVFFDDLLFYSQKVLGLLNVTLKEQQVVAIKSVCSSNDTFVCFPTGYMKSIYYQV